MRLIITGGAGFIGSAVVRKAISKGHVVLNIDALKYAGTLRKLESVVHEENYHFANIDICDTLQLESVIFDFQPDAIMHLAAESHVDRSIDNPENFIQSNILGTYSLLKIARKYSLSPSANKFFRFLHVSTDEVYGSLELGSNELFTELTPYKPSSPYSATKACSDHLTYAWHHTYGLPAIITNCSNNYGPFQNAEKFIPTVLRHILSSRKIPIYGDGLNVRDWLYVDDHVDALFAILDKGKLGQSYNIGGKNEVSNIDLVKAIISILEKKPEIEIGRFEDIIHFVEDRLGHDRRYAINSRKLENEVGFVPRTNFSDGLQKTVDWYLENKNWCFEV